MASPALTNTVASSFSRPRRNLIFGEGQMAELTRAYDWSRTPVGPIDTWPDALLISVNTILGSRHPMFLWWGA